MIVDSSVLIPLARVGRLDLLHDLFAEVMIPTGVHLEVSDSGPGAMMYTEFCAEWIRVVDLDSRPDRGNSIPVLADRYGLALVDAELLLLARDEDQALLTNDAALIRTGRSMGIECWWLTTMLVFAYKKEILDRSQIHALISDLLQEGLWISPVVVSSMYSRMERT